MTAKLIRAHYVLQFIRDKQEEGYEFSRYDYHLLTRYVLGDLLYGQVIELSETRLLAGKIDDLLQVEAHALHLAPD